MTLEEFKESKAYTYALDVLENKFPTNKYIKKICEKFLYEVDNQDEDDFKFFFDLEMAEKIINLMKIINFATGSVAGKSLYNTCIGYQYFLVLNIFCWKKKSNSEKRRYEVCLLWIARKNSKSVNAGLFMILLMLLEPQFSEFYLCANTRDQAKIVYEETKKLIKCSPYIKDKFKIRRDYIQCTLNENVLKALSSDYNTTDGLRVSAACIDEVGAAKNSGLIESMSSGMLSVSNRLLIMISTSYPNKKNPFLEYTEYAKKVMDGLVEDEKLFAMLFSLDEKDELSIDNFLKANPLQAVLKEGREYLKSEYKKALEMGGEKLDSFKCKHLNIWLDGQTVESYIDIDDLKQCKIDNFDWSGRDVYIGLDLSMTTDNCSFSMLTEEDGEVYGESFAFIPEDRIEDKNKLEKINYYEHIKAGKCFSCGDRTVDYLFIEKMILDIENKYDVSVQSIGYDRYNCMSSAQKLEAEGYKVVEIKQHSSVLHPPTKLLEELILNRRFHYTENKLLEINFQNAKCQYDTNLNRYITKKKSSGKVDMVVSLINAMYLLNLEVMLNNDMDWSVQVL